MADDLTDDSSPLPCRPEACRTLLHHFRVQAVEKVGYGDQLTCSFVGINVLHGSGRTHYHQRRHSTTKKPTRPPPTSEHLTHPIFLHHRRPDRLDVPVLKLTRFHFVSVHDLHGDTMPPQLLRSCDSCLNSRIGWQVTQDLPRRIIEKELLPIGLKFSHHTLRYAVLIVGSNRSPIMVNP